MPHTAQTVAKRAPERVPTSFLYIDHALSTIQISSDTNQVNRNKKSLGLSFQHESGVNILHKLVKECDVLVENYLPDALKKYGMDYESVSKINPSIIYASITGYGQTGPLRKKAGYDVMVEACVNLRPRQKPRLLMKHTARWVSCTSPAIEMAHLPRSVSQSQT